VTGDGGRSGTPPGPEKLAHGMERLWHRYRAGSEERIDVVDDAARAAVARAGSPELRRAAEVAAHNLVGSLGTFGLAEGSLVAAEIEDILSSGEEVDARSAQRILELTGTLRRLITSHSPTR